MARGDARWFGDDEVDDVVVCPGELVDMTVID